MSDQDPVAVRFYLLLRKQTKEERTSYGYMEHDLCMWNYVAIADRVLAQQKSLLEQCLTPFRVERSHLMRGRTVGARPATWMFIITTTLARKLGIHDGFSGVF